MKKITYLIILVSILLGCKDDIEEVTTYNMYVPIDLALKVGETKQLKAEIKPEIKDAKDFVWRSSSILIATVTNEGVIKGVSEGEVTVTISSKELNTTRTLIVNVSPIRAETIILNKTELTLTKGKSEKLRVALSLDKPIQWKTSDGNIATVSDDGTVKAKNKGKCEITAISNGIKAVCQVMVASAKIDAIVLNKNSMTLTKGDVEVLRATLIPNNAASKVDKWKTSDSNIATVSDNGSIEAKNEGKCEITVFSNGKKAICQVIVISEKVSSVEITSDNLKIYEENGVKYLDIYVGDTKELIINVLPSNAKNKAVVWKSENDFVTVDDNGVIKGIVPNKEVEISVTTLDGDKVSKIHVKTLSIDDFVKVRASASISSYFQGQLRARLYSNLINVGTKKIKVIGVVVINKKDNTIKKEVSINKELLPSKEIKGPSVNVDEYHPSYIFKWEFEFKGQRYFVSGNSVPTF